MYYKPTTALKKILALKKRIRAVSGGTGASKTVAILMWIIDYCQTRKGKVVSVISESFPHLSLGAIREFKSIMLDRGYWNDKLWHDGQHTYTFETDTMLEFVSMDKLGKAHGPRRDVLFVNECNNIEWPIVDQLMTRTKETIWLDWNPTSEFYFYTDILGRRNDIDFMGDGGNYPPLTYIDNEALDEGQLGEILAHKNNEQWWRVYGLGLLGEVQTRIYTGWNIIDDIPWEARLERHWLDFGYSNDPTAIGDLYYYNNSYILDEQTYQKGLSNKQIADVLKNLKPALTIADSAEPKSIDEIMSYGINILPCEKGKDSKKHGIDVVQSQRIAVTKRSLNIIKEYRNYLWQIDKNGKILNEPAKMFDHHMDGIRYAMTSLVPVKRREDFIRSLPRPWTAPKTNPAR